MCHCSCVQPAKRRRAAETGWPIGQPADLDTHVTLSFHDDFTQGIDELMTAEACQFMWQCAGANCSTGRGSIVVWAEPPAGMTQQQMLDMATAERLCCRAETSYVILPDGSTHIHAGAPML